MQLSLKNKLYKYVFLYLKLVISGQPKKYKGDYIHKIPLFSEVNNQASLKRVKKKRRSIVVIQIKEDFPDASLLWHYHPS